MTRSSFRSVQPAGRSNTSGVVGCPGARCGTTMRRPTRCRDLICAARPRSSRTCRPTWPSASPPASLMMARSSASSSQSGASPEAPACPPLVMRARNSSDFWSKPAILSSRTSGSASFRNWSLLQPRLSLSWRSLAWNCGVFSRASARSAPRRLVHHRFEIALAALGLGSAPARMPAAASATSETATDKTRARRIARPPPSTRRLPMARMAAPRKVQDEHGNQRSQQSAFRAALRTPARICWTWGSRAAPAGPPARARRPSPAAPTSAA